jgi:hypothetical protein
MRVLLLEQSVLATAPLSAKRFRVLEELTAETAYELDLMLIQTAMRHSPR